MSSGPSDAAAPVPRAGATLLPRRRIPLALKLAVTAYALVLVPCYWQQYGPTNFLFFCDAALLLSLLALWVENTLLVSALALAILLPQAVWIVDFVALGVLRRSPLGLTGYMFDSTIPLYLRGLSLFHFWMPILLFWLVWRLRYDRRALPLAIAGGWLILLICYVFVPGPGPHAPPGAGRYPHPATNVNYVFGLSDTAPQPWLDSRLWLALMMFVFALGVCLPTHLILKRLFGRCPTAPARG